MVSLPLRMEWHINLFLGSSSNACKYSCVGKKKRDNPDHNRLCENGPMVYYRWSSWHTADPVFGIIRNETLGIVLGFCKSSNLECVALGWISLPVAIFQRNWNSHMIKISMKLHYSDVCNGFCIWFLKCSNISLLFFY